MSIDENKQDQSPSDLPKAVRPYIGFVLSKVSQTVVEHVEEKLLPYNIQSRHFGILRLVSSSESLQQSEIGRLLRIDRTTMVKMIDDLESLGLIERKRDLKDRRAYAIYMTAAGKHILPEMSEIVQQAEQTAISNLTDTEAQELHHLLTKISQPANEA